jgi:hypothetical protein
MTAKYASLKKPRFFIPLLAVVLVLVTALLQKITLDTAAARYEQAISSYVDTLGTLSSDTIKQQPPKQPVLEAKSLTFLSSAYQTAQKKQLVVDQAVTYIGELSDRSKQKTGSLASEIYLYYIDDYSVRLDASARAHSETAAAPGSDEQLIVSRTAQLTAYRDSAAKYKASIERSTTRHELHAAQADATVKQLAAYIDTINECLSKMKANPAKAVAINDEYLSRLERYPYEIQDYFTYIERYPDAFKTIDPIKITVQRTKDQLHVSESLTAPETRLYSFIDTRTALAKALLPTDSSDTQYADKANVVRVLLRDMLASIASARLSPQQQEALTDTITAAQASLSLYDDPADANNNAGGFTYALLAAAEFDSPYYNTSKSFARTYQRSLDALNKLRVPRYVSAEYGKLTSGYKEATIEFEKAEKLDREVDKLTKAKALDDVLAAYKLQSQARELRARGTAIIETARQQILAIGTKIDDTPRLTQNASQQLDDIPRQIQTR